MQTKKVNFLEKLSLLDGSIEHLLVSDALNYRTSDNRITSGQNVASTLFVWQGQRFGPFSSESKGKGQDKTRHSERLALAIIIRESIKAGWGPFAALKEQNIPETLSIEEIEKDSELLKALQALGEIHIFSERIPCDWEKEDDDCKRYLEGLDAAVGERKVHAYHALPPTKEIGGGEERNLIEKNVEAGRLIIRRRELVELRESCKNDYSEEIKKMENQEKRKNLVIAQRRKLDDLDKESKAIETQLKTEFNFSFPAASFVSSISPQSTLVASASSSSPTAPLLQPQTRPSGSSFHLQPMGPVTGQRTESPWPARSPTTDTNTKKREQPQDESLSSGNPQANAPELDETEGSKKKKLRGPSLKPSGRNDNPESE